MAAVALLASSVAGAGLSSVAGAGLKSSFYILFANQIDSPQWPTKVCQNGGVGPQGGECVDPSTYADGVFITSPQNISVDHVAKVKRDIPGSRLVGYFDFGELPLRLDDDPDCISGCEMLHGHVMGDRDDRNCSTTYPCGEGEYTRSLQRTFSKELVARRLHDNGTYSVPAGYPGLATFIWNQRSAPLMAEFLSDWLTAHGFDGIYLDGYVQPDKRSFDAFDGYDVDGDGKAETAAEVAAMYYAWAPAFVAMVRQRLGRDALILANSAGSVSDPSLSGLTIEMEACAHASEKACAASLQGQHAATASAGLEALSVMWLTHAESMSAAQQCANVHALQEKFEWVQAGTDFFDGSHIVCNHTTATDAA